MSLNFEISEIKKNMFCAEFGLERESLRINADGALAHTPHPFGLNSHIDRDFCENQVEFITDVFTSPKEVCRQLRQLHIYAHKTLSALKSGREYLWCFSNPPYVNGEDDIPVAHFEGDLKQKEVYRNYLAQKYGKTKMLYSGIHLNFSFSEKLVAEGFKKSSFNSLREYKDNLYLELAKKVTSYSWLIVYLTASSSVMDGSFFDKNDKGKTLITDYSSSRCSEIGYWNDFVPLISYDSTQAYINSIQAYVDSGSLRAVSELYYPVRLKPKGSNSLENLGKLGINHIELRMFDTNPLSPIGIFEEDIQFIHLLILYLISQPDIKFSKAEQKAAIINSKNGAKYDDESTLITINNNSIPLKGAALEVLEDMESFYAELENTSALQSITAQKSKILSSDKRYAAILRKDFGKNYVEKGIELAKAYSDKLIKEG
jgi:glutamate--cysteine ligase